VKQIQVSFRFVPETMKAWQRLKAAHTDIPGNRLISNLIRRKDKAIQERLPADLLLKYIAGQLMIDEWREGIARSDVARQRLGQDADTNAVAELAATIKINPSPTICRRSREGKGDV